ELLPKDAQVVNQDDSITSKPLNELKVGEIVRVQAGENIPADGVIVRGRSRVNESLLTGESAPIEKNKGDTAIGGSTNGPGVLFIEVSEIGEKSFISQVQTLVGEAQSQPSRAEDMANRVASWLFWIALGAAILAFIIWLFISDLPTAVTFTVTTLVIACPHALGLAIPLVISRSTSLGAKRALLVKNREAYELTTKADVMILDKTGTLTTGEFKVLDTQVLDDNYREDEIIALLAGIEGGSSHPIAQSIISHAEEKDIELVNFETNDVISGEGVSGEVNGKVYKLISEKAYGQKLNVDTPVGATLSVLTENDEAIGTVALGDDLKPTSKELMNILKSQGIEPIIATGDNESAAEAVAEELDVEYFANMSPQDKYDLVERYKNQNKTVLMVGDGVNDAPSLALADVGVAVGAGTQVALDSADVILTQSDPGDIESFIELSIKTNKKMNQNLAWGAGYNFIAIPIAAGILAPIGITLSPAVGAILMSLSTIIVAVNAMTLKLDSK
ncbi:MAG: copper-translocating P-type ATPase, partial [Atopococcus tabaci]|nr:copper-translocating P-type ATPase [Atopococcus tabaci]